MARLRVVIDTNIVFEGITRRGGPAGAIVEGWLLEWFQPCVSVALVYEYTEVLSRKLRPERWRRVQKVLDVLLGRAELIVNHFSWRPSSPDPGDEHVIDCAMTARAAVVTSNTKDFRLAQETLGLTVLTPAQFLLVLGSHGSDPEETRK